MKLASLFADLLRDTVNLNQTRIDQLNGSIGALQDFVRECDWGPKVRAFEEQGSWAHDTIIRPVDGGEFDADLLVLVDPVDGWSAADYVRKLGEAFADSGVYGDKVKTWDYCVTLTYVGDRKVDIAPCVVGRRGDGSLEVCNRSTDDFELSEPIVYTNWLKERNAYSGSNSFRKVTRLIKYLRDIKQTFTCPSVLLTTLLGYRIEWFDKDTDEFADTPTTLRTVMGRLDDWLQANAVKPCVANPALLSEDFAAGWTDGQYNNFRNFVHKYRGWIDEAFEAEGRPESIKAWRRVFGDDFAKGEDVSVSKVLTEGMAAARSMLMASAAHLDELVEVVRNFGLSVLPAGFSRPPHLQEPPWRQAVSVSSSVSVSATWHSGEHSNQGRPVRIGDILPPRGGLWFDVRVNGVEPVPSGFRVQWRITNTGAVAMALRAGRGDFYPPKVGVRRWETLQYRGVHIAEAFVIRMSDDVLVGQSPPFFVVIE